VVKGVIQHNVIKTQSFDAGYNIYAEHTGFLNLQYIVGKTYKLMVLLYRIT
jgi:hypothetical protein